MHKRVKMGQGRADFPQKSRGEQLPTLHHPHVQPSLPDDLFPCLFNFDNTEHFIEESKSLLESRTPGVI